MADTSVHQRASNQPPFTEDELAWIEEHMAELRSITEQRIRYRILLVSLVVGVALHAGGFLIKASASLLPVVLLGDLLYTLGWGLWTGAVVVVLLQILPEAKHRQITNALNAYEAALRRRTKTVSQGRERATPRSPQER